MSLLTTTGASLKLTVNNHSFVVIPPFTIIRPITSTESTLIALEEGKSSIDYIVNDIINDPVSYSIELNCIGCSDNFPRQYYTPDGNSFGLTNPAFIDPDNLPATLNLTTITRASIAGEIDLGRVSDRDLVFTVTVLSARNPQQSFETETSIILSAGSRNTTYEISGLNRAIGDDQYTVQLLCTNCFGVSRQPNTFSQNLSPNENHSNINFSMTDTPPISIAPILDLLFE